MIRRFALTLIIISVHAAPGFAAPPDLKTPAPVIFLADNLDEAENLGWCIDTVGRGLSDQLHAHSCKPRGGDVQFRYDETAQTIESVAFAGLCVTFAGTLPIGLLECDGSEAQSFQYDLETMTFRFGSASDQCLAVGDESRSAGPFMSRNLVIADCNSTDPKLKTWLVKD